ncbi:hypothetical protein HK100_002535 [Physocladia obscura]|uniref:Arp2/3 complex 41 kDa subunit n=1 Tax=Physocladia obscura TaxID=109957 RepID=A0AAD5SWZ9_9FUNG|nr:hypothetical protein HK100_002535 [Physocladia obscura]
MSRLAIPPEIHQIFHGVPVTCHAFNRDRTSMSLTGMINNFFLIYFISEIAVSPSSHEVHVYRKNGSGWTLEQILDEHDKLVTSVDWAPISNKLVTCAQDRNAYVWTIDAPTGKWKPQLVLLRINRAATFVRWSPQENKFAVATGSRLVAVAHLDVDNDWYTTKHIRKPLRSTVTAVAWHKDNILLATGGADGVARVFSAFVKTVDEKAVSPVWGDKLPFATLCAEFGSLNNGPVHSTAHDGNVVFAYGPQGPLISAPTTGLPLITSLFVAEDALVAAGHDCVPLLFKILANNQWALVDRIDKGNNNKSVSSENSAMDMFKKLARTAQATADVELNSVHQNTIT